MTDMTKADDLPRWFVHTLIAVIEGGASKDSESLYEALREEGVTIRLTVNDKPVDFYGVVTELRQWDTDVVDRMVGKRLAALLDSAESAAMDALIRCREELKNALPESLEIPDR